MLMTNKLDRVVKNYFSYPLNLSYHRLPAFILFALLIKSL